MGKGRKKIAERQASKVAVSPTFIQYNHLGRDDRLFFAHCGLDRFIGIASKILRKRLGPAEIYKLDRPYFSEAGLSTLNGLISEILTIIGSHSNYRFGNEAANQDRYFRRPTERNTFPTHLFISRWQDGCRQLIEKNPGNKEKITAAGNQPGVVFSKKLFKGISAAKKLTYGPSKLGEIETRAVGLLYMIDLAWTTLRENREPTADGHATRASLPDVLQAGFALFSLLDESEQAVSRSEGGRSGNKTKRFEEAARIVRAIVQAEPDKDTAILAKRAEQRVSGECVDQEVPSYRWIAQEVRKIRKTLRRN